MSDESKYFIYSIFGMIGGIGLFFWSLRNFYKVRLITNTPTSKIRSLAMGRVEVQGAIKPYHDKTYTAPFSQKKCYFCKWLVEEYRGNGRSGRWYTIKEGFIGDYFYVQDDTGKVLVDGRGAELGIQPDYQSRKKTPKIEEFLSINNIKTKGMVFTKRLRFTEHTLEIDNQLYINAVARQNPFTQSSAINTETLILTGGNRLTKGKSALFSKEWFYISDKSEKEALRSIFWKNIFFVVCGAVLGVGSLAYVLAYLRLL